MTHIDSVDRITTGLLTELAALPGPVATITLPTFRAGAETRQGPILLRNLTRKALELGRESGWAQGELDAVASALDELAADNEFWQRTADGLVVLASPQGLRTVRVAAELPASARVAQDAGLRELVRQQDSDEPWFIVAVSGNRLALFEATGNTIDEIELEDVPGSADEAIGHLERQSHLHLAAQGGGEASFHGHGADSRADQVWLEKYLRSVASGLDSHSARPGASKVVLVGVPHVVATLRSVWRAPGVVVGSVDGNPDRLSAAELHALARPLMVEQDEAEDRAWVERVAGDRQRGLSDLGDVVQAAAHARLDTLLLGEAHPHQVAADGVESAIRDTLVSSGRVRPIDDADIVMLGWARY